DVRETAFTSARLVRDALLARGAHVFADDPLYTPAELDSMGYSPLPESQRAEVRALVLQAAHSAYATLDLSQFPACQVVLDGRRGLKREAVEVAGMRYLY